MPVFYYKTVLVDVTEEDRVRPSIGATLDSTPCVIIPLFRPKSAVGRYLADPDTFAVFNYELRDRAIFLLPAGSAEARYA